ncbi:MAG TPA: SRPBCC domain-containing protein [Chryseosolibacter sp.]
MKTHKHFTTALVVDQSPEQVFNAITNVRGWWSETIEGNTAKLGDEFLFEVKGIHRSTQKLVEVIPNKKIVWLISNSQLTFISDTSEWDGTKVIFDISPVKNNKTQLTFTHEGLVPEVECYAACSPAWTQYIQHSLLSLITTGKGDPNLEGRKIKAIQV